MEHLHHFGLSLDPFRDDPRLRDYVETLASRDALLRLDRGLRQLRGLLVLSGPVGSGKTMVVRRLLESLEEEMFEASMLVVVNGAADAGGLLARYAGQLGIEAPAAQRQALLGQLYEQLAIVREDGRHAVLIIDDADVLAGGGALAEVCGLLKLEYEERRLLSLVLAGGPGLDARLAADPGLAHRVDVRVSLRGLDEEGTNEYLDHRLKLADGARELFEPEARAALHRLGCGLPGLVNRLADNALFEAFLCDRATVGAADVERAHRNLGWQPPSDGRHGSAGPGRESGASAAAALRVPESSAAAEWGATRAESHRSAPFSADDEDSLRELDSELEAIFDSAACETDAPGPHSSDPDDRRLVAELLED